MYMLRYPLDLAPHSSFYKLAAPVTIEGRRWDLQKQDKEWILLIHDFQNPQEAQQYLPRLRQLLDYLMLTSRITIVHTNSVETLTASTSPHAMANACTAVIHPESIRPQIVSSWATVQNVSQPEPIFARVAVMAPSLPLPNEDLKLSIALDLYRTYDRDASQTSRFLMLVMVLEALAEPETRPDPVVALINTWRTDAMARSKTLPAVLSDIWQKLANELAFHRYNSITDQIVHLVLAAIKPTDDQTANQLSREVRQMYTVRSQLLHTGRTTEDRSAAFQLAWRVTPQVLLARLLGS